MAKHNELGKQGEKAAAEFLREAGHEILATNYRFSRAEVDIISKEKNIVVFTEVKTRATEQFGLPEQSVDRKKIKLLKKAAEEFMYRNDFSSEIRFDIISIVPEKAKLKIHHIKDAFFYTEDNIGYD